MYEEESKWRYMGAEGRKGRVREKKSNRKKGDVKGMEVGSKVKRKKLKHGEIG